MHGLSVAKQMTRTVANRAPRRHLSLPGRVTWKDSRGTMRFASVMTRDVSETGVYIEWSESTTIPLYRLVTFQLERDVRNIESLPYALKTGKILSAVYRAGAVQKSTGTPDGYGLRLLVEPSAAARTLAEPIEATA